MLVRKIVVDPQIGEEKVERKFAFLPVELTNGEVIWFEWYNVFYEYKNSFKPFKTSDANDDFAPRERHPVLGQYGGRMASILPAGYFQNSWVECSKKRI